MTQEERWLLRYNEVKGFIETDEDDKYIETLFKRIVNR